MRHEVPAIKGPTKENKTISKHAPFQSMDIQIADGYGYS